MNCKKCSKPVEPLPKSARVYGTMARLRDGSVRDLEVCGLCESKANPNDGRVFCPSCGTRLRNELCRCPCVAST